MDGNKYLEKIAAHYNVRPHADDKRFGSIQSVSLNEKDLHKYEKGRTNAITFPKLLAATVGAGGAGYAAGHYLHKGVMRAQAMKTLGSKTREEAIRNLQTGRVLKGLKGRFKAYGTLGGALLGEHILDNHLHNRGMESAGAVQMHKEHHFNDKK